ncbi:MAG: UDP-galactopyranose mutase [Clostridiales bacterium]|nr:UDP-galactopyranose mutase [Clostridiales bacterium]
MLYDFLIVGAGLFGSVFAARMRENGKTCLVIEKREHIGGNVYTARIEGINVHNYGAHIFHTSNRTVWDYINRFAEFNNYINSPIANYKGKIYNLPFNMNTFYQMWGTVTPDEAKAEIERQRIALTGEPRNLEEQALSLVGSDIYEVLIKGYTEKQWGRPCAELPADTIKRLPMRFTYDNNYFKDTYQGIPVSGYTRIINQMLDGVEVIVGLDFLTERERLRKLAKTIIFTGSIDSYFDYSLGALDYRSVRFETETIQTDNYQGNAVVNYTDSETPYTRIIEHKRFEFGIQPTTVISKEYPLEWKLGEEAYYPIGDEKNVKLYEMYRKLAENERDVIFGGRLGLYQYLDMDDVIELALRLAAKAV